MKIEELAAAGHDYYCSESNYYSKEPRSVYETFSDFTDEWGEHDIDMNLIFRWDIAINEDNDENPTGYNAEIFMIQQRKGIFKPIRIENITQDDIPKFIEIVTPHWEKLKKIWRPISE